MHYGPDLVYEDVSDFQYPPGEKKTGLSLNLTYGGLSTAKTTREEKPTDCQSNLIVEDWLTVPVTRGEKSTRSIEPTKQQQHCFQHKNLCYSHFYQSHPLTQPE